MTQLAVGSVLKNRAGVRFRIVSIRKYDPDQPRANNGEWTSGGEDGAPLSEKELTGLEPRWKDIKDVKMRDKMQAAVRNWTGTNSDDINGALRTGDRLDWTTGPQQMDIRRLDKTFEMAGHDLPRDALVYRGVTGDKLGELKVGAEFEDRGFNSTTHDATVAKPFADAPDGRMLHITVPKGTRVVSPITPETEDDPGGVEPELLLNRGTKYRVTSVSGRDVHVRVFR